MFKLSFRLLIQAENISHRIGKSRSNFRCIGADWLRNPSAARSYSGNGFGDAVDHDVDQQAHLRHRFAMQNPRTADLADAIVECDAPIAAGPDVPTENLSVERNRGLDIDRRDFDIADFSVTECRLHGVLIL